MKTKLFSKETFFVSLKALGSSLVSSICALPLWALSYYLMSKGLMIFGGVVSLFTIIVAFLFFGYWSRVFWKWK